MCERSVPQAAIPPPQMTIDDTNSSRNHKAWSDYKHNESLTYYCWLNGAMGKGHCKRFSGVFPLFYSSRLFTFYGPTLGLRLAPFFSSSVYSSGSVFFLSHDNFEVSARVLMRFAFLLLAVCVCVRCHPEKHKCAPPPTLPPPLPHPPSTFMCVW